MKANHLRYLQMFDVFNSEMFVSIQITENEIDADVAVYDTEEPKRYPKPDYNRCNAGHELVEVYDEKRHALIWDCPICIKKMEVN